MTISMLTQELLCKQPIRTGKHQYKVPSSLWLILFLFPVVCLFICVCFFIPSSALLPALSNQPFLFTSALCLFFLITPSSLSLSFYLSFFLWSCASLPFLSLSVFFSPFLYSFSSSFPLLSLISQMIIWPLLCVTFLKSNQRGAFILIIISDTLLHAHCTSCLVLGEEFLSLILSRNTVTWLCLLSGSTPETQFIYIYI